MIRKSSYKYLFIYFIYLFITADAELNSVTQLFFIFFYILQNLNLYNNLQMHYRRLMVIIDSVTKTNLLTW